MSRGMNRRDFLRGAGSAGAVITFGGLQGCARQAPRRISPNEKLNIAMVGTAHRAAENIRQVMHENIVALCDVDDNYLAVAAKQFPSAKTYNDFRKMLEQPDIDAVLVATPDHIHAPASLAAMEMGKHVYCEKPLTHSIHEAREMAKAAKRAGVATQMGTQIHAGDNYRRVVEIIQSGAIGPVTDVHVWVGKTWSGGERPKETPPVPANLHWDLWLGPAPERPYHPIYVPQNWRRWWDFGGGTLGDMGCHYMDLPYWALGLERPVSAEAKGPAVSDETAPPKLAVTWEFPERGNQPPVTMTWYDDGLQPAEIKENNLPAWESGVLFIGSKGMMLAGYNEYKLFPEKEFEGYEPPAPTIPRSIGHHNEWIQACKTGEPTTCHFAYSGMLTETVLLGNVAFRCGQKLDWDGRRLRARNCAAADELIRREYRKGWAV